MFPIRDHNPSGRTPYVTYGLLIANIAIWLWSVTMITNDNALNWFYYNYALIPARMADGTGFGGLVTSMFVHAGFLHLACNMLFLFIFGDNMEDRMGHGSFAVFYACCGIAAGLAQVMIDPASAVPTVGASGAIAGVMGGYLLLFPRAHVDIVLILIVFFKVFPVPAWLILGLWFGMQAFRGLGPQADGIVAYWAHMGGFVAGIILTVPLWRRLGGTAFWQVTHAVPPHPPMTYMDGSSRFPTVRRKR